MDLNKETYETISRFLKGQMNDQEISVFEQKMSEDSALKNAVETEREIIKGIRSSARTDFKKSLDEIHARMNEESEASDISPPKKKNNWLWLLICFAIVGLFSYLFWPKPPTTAKEDVSEIPYAAGQPDWSGLVAVYEKAVFTDKKDLSTATKIDEINTFLFLDAKGAPSYNFDLESKQLKLHFPAASTSKIKSPVLYQQDNNWLLDLDGLLYTIEESSSESPLRKIN